VKSSDSTRLYIANEGKVIVVAGNEDSGKVLSVIRRSDEGKEGAIIGEIVKLNIPER